MKSKRRKKMLPKMKDHKCWDNPVYVETNGAIGHGFECGVCGAFLQAG